MSSKLFSTLIASILILSTQMSWAKKASEQAAEKPNPKDNEVVASINDHKITLGEFKRKYNDLRNQTLNPPPPDLFLEDLVRYELGLQEAKKRNLEKDPSVLDRMNQELYKGLVEKAIADKVGAIKVTDAEMEKYYKENPEIRSSHILIEYAPSATPEQKAAAKKRADEIYAEVKASKRPFEELAPLYSDDSLSKNNGGDVGWQTRITLVPPYYEALMAMKVNEVRGVIETPYGYHIVKLTGRHAFNEANKRAIKAAVFDQKRKVIFDEFFAGLKKNYSIKTNASLLK